MYKDKILRVALVLNEFSIRMMIKELNLPDNKLEQMEIARILKEAGYRKKQVRFDHKTLRVVWSK